MGPTIVQIFHYLLHSVLMRMPELLNYSLTDDEMRMRNEMILRMRGEDIINGGLSKMDNLFLVYH